MLVMNERETENFFNDLLISTKLNLLIGNEKRRYLSSPKPTCACLIRLFIGRDNNLQFPYHSL